MLWWCWCGDMGINRALPFQMRGLLFPNEKIIIPFKAGLIGLLLLLLLKVSSSSGGNYTANESTQTHTNGWMDGAMEAKKNFRRRRNRV